MRFKPQNSANHLVWVEWPSKFDSLNGRDGRPRPSHLSAGWRCEWRELDSLKSKRLATRFLHVLSGRKASHGAARPPRPTISGNPACSTLRRFRGQTLSCEVPLGRWPARREETEITEGLRSEPLPFMNRWNSEAKEKFFDPSI
jgi:hypothetical protein